MILCIYVSVYVCILCILSVSIVLYNTLVVYIIPLHITQSGSIILSKCLTQFTSLFGYLKWEASLFVKSIEVEGYASHDLLSNIQLV